MAKRSIQLEEQPFAVALVNATAGATKYVDRFDTAHAVVAFYNFNGAPGSYILQGTVDGNDWVTISGGIAAAVLVPLTHYWRALRVFTTTAGGAPPTVAFGAHELTW